MAAWIRSIPPSVWGRESDEWQPSTPTTESGNR